VVMVHSKVAFRHYNGGNEENKSTLQLGRLVSGRDAIRLPPEQHRVTDCDRSPVLTADDRCRIFDSRNLF
jgi:hypothetical protein